MQDIAVVIGLCLLWAMLVFVAIWVAAIALLTEWVIGEVRKMSR